MAREKSTDKEPQLEIKARWSGPEFWKDWGKGKKRGGGSDGGGAVYFFGMVGSFVYFMQAAVGFGAVVTGILKSFVWPAYIVYKLLEQFYGVAK